MDQLEEEYLEKVVQLDEDINDDNIEWIDGVGYDITMPSARTVRICKSNEKKVPLDVPDALGF